MVRLFGAWCVWCSGRLAAHSACNAAKVGRPVVPYRQWESQKWNVWEWTGSDLPSLARRQVNKVNKQDAGICRHSLSNKQYQSGTGINYLVNCVTFNYCTLKYLLVGWTSEASGILSLRDNERNILHTVHVFERKYRSSSSMGQIACTVSKWSF